MRKNAIYIPNPQEDLRTIEDDNQYDQVAPDEIRSLSSESDLAESAGRSYDPVIVQITDIWHSIRTLSG